MKNEELAELNREKTNKRVQDALKKLKKKKTIISLSQLAKEAGVSRQTLYNRPDLKGKLDELNSLTMDKQNSKQVQGKKTTTQESRILKLKDELQKVKGDYTKLLDQNVALTEMNFRKDAKIAELEEKLFKDKVIQLVKRD